MDTSRDFALDYAKDYLGASWGGFVTWATENGYVTEDSLKCMSLEERTSFTEDYWDIYVKDLDEAEQDHLEDMRMRLTVIGG